MFYDIIIIGGGISGLNTCNELLNSNKKIMLIDKRNYIGGRIKTGKMAGVNIEIGAARFNKNHRYLINLIKKYKLTPFKLNNKQHYIQNTGDKISNISNPNHIYRYFINHIIRLSKEIPKSYLKTITFYTLCLKYYSKNDVDLIVNMFGYNAEFGNYNAFDAINTFKKNFINNDFYVVTDGLSHLCISMKKEIIKKGGNVLLNTTINNIQEKINNTFILTDTSKNTYTCTTLIMCIKPYELLNFEYFNNIKDIIHSVLPIPILRVFFKYPLINNKVWFQNIPKTSTNNPLRFIIPINLKKGIIMISYTDSEFTNYWMKYTNDNDLIDEVQRNLNILYPDIDIPYPEEIKKYYWKEGVHLWKPNVDSEILSNKILKPYSDKKIYIGGEGFSNNQSWMEGGLETSTEIIELLQ